MAFRYGWLKRLLSGRTSPSVGVVESHARVSGSNGLHGFLPDDAQNITAVNVTAGKAPIAKITVDGVSTPHPYALMIPQYDTEQLLGDFVTSLGVKIEWNIELTDFVVSADGVTSTLHHIDGTEENFESGWVIGSDGAHSTVRHKLGMEFAGETMPSSGSL